MNHTAFRRRATCVSLLALGALWWPATAPAQAYPDRTVTLYVGFAVGGSADTVARALADELSKTLG